MSNARSLVVRVLARAFNVVPLPAYLHDIAQAPSEFILLTEGGSVVIESLLLSLARRVGLSKVIKAPTAVDSEVERHHSTLQWQDIYRSDELTAVVKANQGKKFCTFNIFQWRGPLRNPPKRPGFFWPLTMLLARRLLFVIIGTPISLPPVTANRLLRMIRVDVFKNIKIVRGTPFQSLETQTRVILSGPEFERELRVVAERTRKPVAKARREALNAFYEIAANPRRPMYSLVAIVARFAVRRLFSDVITTGLERLIPAIKNHTVILVPMHRSHLDYILVGYKLFESNINPPLVAAGMNLCFWPVGYMMRRVGTYFVKRNARERLHAVILRRYITYLIQRGHLQEFFIEGGRSRSGKMLQPKHGLLNIIFDAWMQNVNEDILFVPVSITYENLVEEEAFADENIGKQKKKENFVSLIRALGIFQKKYGEVIINFGGPVSLAQFCEMHQLRAPQRRALRGKADTRALVQQLGLEIVRRIRNQINPSLTNLGYSALLMAPYYGLKRAELARTLKGMCQYMIWLKEGNPEIGDFTPALQRFLAGRESILYELRHGDVVRIESCLDSDVFFIPGRKRFTADFYRNSVMHFFFPLSVLALLDLMGCDLTADEAAKFHAVFEYDFILPELQQFSKELNLVIELLRKNGYLREQNGRLQFVRPYPPLFMPAMIQSSIQCLLWLYYTFKFNYSCLDEEASGESTRVLSYNRLLDCAQEEAKAAAYLGVLGRTEAASRTSIMSAMESLEARGIISYMEGAGQPKRIVVKRECDHEVDLLVRANAAILSFQQGAVQRLYGLQTREEEAAALAES